MTTQLKLRKGTTAQHSTFTGAQAEVTVDTDKKTVVVHDGSTAGGFPLAKERFTQTETGAVNRTVDEKLKDTVSIKDFGAVGDGSTNDTTAFQQADASSASEIYIPSGTYLVNGSTVLTKRYSGPGSISYSGIGSVTFTGGGLNDATFGGTYTGNRPLNVVVKINSTGIPDALAYSFDGGSTFITTQDTFDPINDVYITGPINIVSGAMPIFHGVTVTFGATTGHTLNSTWTFTLRPNPHVINTNGRNISIGGQPFAAPIGVHNTQVGLGAFGAGKSIGIENTVLGFESMYNNTRGYANTALGSEALKANTTGAFNQAIGTGVLLNNTTGTENSGTGVYCLRDNTTGTANSSYGVDTMRYNTTGSRNAVVGVQSLYHNMTGVENVAMGAYALRGGTESLSNGFSCDFNTGVGAKALYMGRGSYSTGLGYNAGYNTTGTYNTLVGANSGSAITTGSKNVVLGGYTGNQGGLDIRTSSNWTVLSDGDGNIRLAFNSSGDMLAGGIAAKIADEKFGFGGSVNGHLTRFYNYSGTTPSGIVMYFPYASPNNTTQTFFYAGDSGGDRFLVRSNGGIANYSGNNVNLSDRREKKDIAPSKSYLDVVCSIPVVTFNYIDQPEDDAGTTLGVIAQDVEAVAPELVMESNWAREGEEPKIRKSIYQTDLQYAVMKAVQEQQEIIKTLMARIETLEASK